MEQKFLQSVERYSENEATGYKAIYSNGLDFQTLLFPIKDGKTVINIPSIIKLIMTVEEVENLGAQFD